MKNKSNILCVVLVGVIILLLMFYRKEGKTEFIERHTIDTTYVTLIDTQYITKPMYVEEKIIDTIYIGKDSVDIPLIQRTFTDNSTYKAIVSGYKPNLESMEIYQKTNTRYITKTCTKEITKYEPHIYFGGGFSYIGKEYSPKFILAYTTPKRWIVSFETGLYDKDIFYGFNIGYKIK